MRSSSCTFKKRCSISSTVCVVGHDLVQHGVVHVAAHEHVDLAVERGREQQRLAVVGDLAHDPFDLRQESHVGHAVGFVDDRGSRSRRGRARPARAGRSSGPVSRPRLRSCARGCGSGGPSRCRRRTRRRARRSACRSGSARRRPAWRARASARARARSGGRASTASVVWIAGRPKASVLPEPVLALPHTSRPARASSMVAAWTGNGSSMPCSARASTISALRPSSRNVVTLFSSTCTSSCGGRSSASPDGNR